METQSGHVNSHPEGRPPEAGPRLPEVRGGQAPLAERPEGSQGRRSFAPPSAGLRTTEGEARMVDVSAKRPTVRCAVAGCEVRMKPETFELLKSGALKKGDAFTVAKTAGILAAKKTSDLIPLCHPLPIDHVEIRFYDRPAQDGFFLEAEVRTTARTGVEMEALTGALVAALTLYDMAKSADPGIVINGVHLIHKSGGKSRSVFASQRLNSHCESRPQGGTKQSPSSEIASSSRSAEASAERDSSQRLSLAPPPACRRGRQ